MSWVFCYHLWTSAFWAGNMSHIYSIVVRISPDSHWREDNPSNRKLSFDQIHNDVKKTEFSCNMCVSLYLKRQRLSSNSGELWPPSTNCHLNYCAAIIATHDLYLSIYCDIRTAWYWSVCCCRGAAILTWSFLSWQLRRMQEMLQRIQDQMHTQKEAY